MREKSRIIDNNQSILGMSLLELVLAVGIMGFVMAATFSALSGMLTARSQAKDIAMYQKYLSVIQDQVVKQFQAAALAVGTLPSSVSEMNTWRTNFGTIINRDTGYQIALYVGDSTALSTKLGCQEGTQRISSCSAASYSNGHYDFCVAVTPLNAALFPSQEDLMKMNPVIKYRFQLKNTATLADITSLTDAAIDYASMRVTYTMNWFNKGSTSSSCRYTRGMFYMFP